MNREVAKEINKGLTESGNKKFQILFKKLESRIDKSEATCTNAQCLEEIKVMGQDVVNFLCDSAEQHGLDPYDTIDEVLDLLKVLNAEARIGYQTACNFKAEEKVGFC